MEINNINITPQSGNAGTNIPISISVAAVNEGIDKVVEIDAVCGNKSDRLTIVHEGLREPFGLKGDGVFRLKNGGRFGVLKYKEQPEQPDEPEQPTTEYTELAYIEGTGTQCINLGLLSTAQSKIDIEFSFTSMSSNAAVFGGRNATSSSTFSMFLIVSNSSFRFDFNSQKTVATSSELTWGVHEKYRFSWNGTQADVTNVDTGEVTSMAFSAGTTFTTFPIHLFCVNAKGTLASFMQGRIYRCMYTDGTTTVDLIPVLDKDGVACMYDKVSEQYFYNAGTGSFIAGYKQ